MIHVHVYIYIHTYMSCCSKSVYMYILYPSAVASLHRRGRFRVVAAELRQLIVRPSSCSIFPTEFLIYFDSSSPVVVMIHNICLELFNLWGVPTHHLCLVFFTWSSCCASFFVRQISCLHPWTVSDGRMTRALQVSASCEAQERLACWVLWLPNDGAHP